MKCVKGLYSKALCNANMYQEALKQVNRFFKCFLAYKQFEGAMEDIKEVGLRGRCLEKELKEYHLLNLLDGTLKFQNARKFPF